MNDIEIKQSAYKHGCTYDDIINCYSFPIAIRVIASDPTKYLYIGFNTKGNPIELLVNHNGKSIVFHAMKLRKVFERMINEKTR